MATSHCGVVLNWAGSVQCALNQTSITSARRKQNCDGRTKEGVVRAPRSSALEKRATCQVNACFGNRKKRIQINREESGDTEAGEGWVPGEGGGLRGMKGRSPRGPQLEGKLCGLRKIESGSFTKHGPFGPLRVKSFEFAKFIAD